MTRVQIRLWDTTVPLQIQPRRTELNRGHHRPKLLLTVLVAGGAWPAGEWISGKRGVAHEPLELARRAHRRQQGILAKSRRIVKTRGNRLAEQAHRFVLKALA